MLTISSQHELLGLTGDVSDRAKAAQEDFTQNTSASWQSFVADDTATHQVDSDAPVHTRSDTALGSNPHSRWSRVGGGERKSEYPIPFPR